MRVELYADGVKGGAPVRQEMTAVRQLAGASGGYVYGAAVLGGSPGSGLYGTGHTTLRRRCDPTGRRANSCGSADRPSRGNSTGTELVGQRAKPPAGSANGEISTHLPGSPASRRQGKKQAVTLHQRPPLDQRFERSRMTGAVMFVTHVSV